MLFFSSSVNASAWFNPKIPAKKRERKNDQNLLHFLMVISSPSSFFIWEESTAIYEAFQSLLKHLELICFSICLMLNEINNRTDVSLRNQDISV